MYFRSYKLYFEDNYKTFKIKSKKLNDYIKCLGFLRYIFLAILGIKTRETRPRNQLFLISMHCFFFL